MMAKLKICVKSVSMNVSLWNQILPLILSYNSLTIPIKLTLDA